MANYLKGALHSNGETYPLVSPEDAKHIANVFPYADKALINEGSKEIRIGYNGTAFLELDVDTTTPPLAPKPECNNWNECVSKETPSDNEEPKKEA